MFFVDSKSKTLFIRSNSNTFSEHLSLNLKKVPGSINAVVGVLQFNI